jgi:5-oxoprolinase (ATP-hydrolysing) subunit A
VLTIDLNADLGEGAGDDDAMLEIVSSANLACGMHAGSLGEMWRLIRLAHENGVRIGAHISYPDRDNFGRVSMADSISTDDLTRALGAQLRSFQAVAGYTPYVKTHGALYNDAGSRELIARWVCAMTPHASAIMHMPGSLVHDEAVSLGIPFIAEAFADRAYLPDGSLMPRSAPGSVLHDASQIADRALDMVYNRSVVAVDGSEVHLPALHSLCVHGDTPGAVQIARTVRSTLEGAGVTVEAPSPTSRNRK